MIHKLQDFSGFQTQYTAFTEPHLDKNNIRETVISVHSVVHFKPVSVGPSLSYFFKSFKKYVFQNL